MHLQKAVSICQSNPDLAREESDLGAPRDEQILFPAGIFLAGKGNSGRQFRKYDFYDKDWDLAGGISMP